MSKIRAKAIRRIEWVKSGVAECEALYNAGKYEACAACAVSVGDSAESACIAFDDMKDCLLGAKNAAFEAFADWSAWADEMEEITRVMDAVCAECAEMLG